jgi:hypothetical protein
MSIGKNILIIKIKLLIKYLKKILKKNIKKKYR